MSNTKYKIEHFLVQQYNNKVLTLFIFFVGRNSASFYIINIIILNARFSKKKNIILAHYDGYAPL